MALFLRLLLGHMIGDYVLQPLPLVLMKRKGWRGILIHVGIVTVVTGILLWPVLGHWWYWLWLLFLFVGHLLIDRSRALALKDLEATSLWYLIIDQTLHLCLIAVIAIQSRTWQTVHPGLPALTASLHENGLIAYLICLVFLIWTVPVLEVETANTLMSNVGNMGQGVGVRITVRERVLGGLERVGGVALTLVGLIYLVPFAFLPRVLLQRGEWHKSPLQGRFLVKMAISFSLTIVIGLLLAWIPFSL